MAETAVGLFEDAGTAEAVVDALRANGIPSRGIRILAKPVGSPVVSATSTPSVDFAAALAQDLRSLGATELERDAYLAGVRRGNVLVFATGSSVQAETAITVMNAYEPIELEEFAAVAQVLPGLHSGEAEAHEGIRLKTDESRAQSEGARVFSW